jgi:hypothetical protein
MLDGVSIAITVMNSSPQVVCSGLWQWVQGTGLECFEFLRVADEWIFRGTILTLAANIAEEAKYEIVCDRSLRTKPANVSVRNTTGERTRQIETESGRWYEMAAKTRRSLESI